MVRCILLADSAESFQFIPTRLLEANGPSTCDHAHSSPLDSVWSCQNGHHILQQLPGAYKGNDQGRFVSEPINPASLVESTGSWEDSAFSPCLMLIYELKAKGNFYRRWRRRCTLGLHTATMMGTW